MKLLLDSHALLWTIYEPERLSRNAAIVIADVDNQLHLSHATVWELSNKAAANRLPGCRVPGAGCRVPGAPHLDSEMWAFAQSANRPLTNKRIDPGFTRNYPESMKVSAQYAQEHLPYLLTAIDIGEEVELTRADGLT